MLTFTIDKSTDLRLLAEEAAVRFDKGEVVLIPTETQYGLCCNSKNVTAMHELNRIKKRDITNPTAVFVRDWSHASQLVESAPDGIQGFLNHFWPGPLTLVAASKERDWKGVVSEFGTVGFRCSSHPFIRQLHAVTAHYLTATSANVHEEPPSVDPDFLTNWLASDIELFIFDPTIKKDAVPSTVVSVAEGRLQILREGAIQSAELELVWQKEIAG